MKRTISVIGLGYVGLPVAVAFGKSAQVVAFDINQERINQLEEGIDLTEEVASKELKSANLLLTSNPADLAKADFHIISVPTPIDETNQPNLKPILSASETIGKHLKKGDIVVYESTVYPGTTEDDCAPVLEKHSGLKCGKDFFIAYSPERINPGDKTHVFTKILKIVSGQTPEVLNIVSEVYESVVTAGVYRASSIKVAEAAKVIENTQRDLNIAFINELAMIFNQLEIDTEEVLKAAGTKWNFLPFRPGLVGGHCIGVDPYYLTHRASLSGYHPELILAGRRINDNMAKYIAEQTVKNMIKLGNCVKGSKVAILGFTFKEDCPDVRNSKIYDIYTELLEYECEVVVADPCAESKEIFQEYGVDIHNLDDITNLSAIVLAVGHQAYKDLNVESIEAMFKDTRLVMDVKSILDKEKMKQSQITVWQL
jgi:UDP-N-acetyl-D-galactosamine dehydrogenase